VRTTSERDEKQRRREDARRLRRENAESQQRPEEPESDNAPETGNGGADSHPQSQTEESHDTLKQAAKVAFAGAAVGAAVGAARALTSREHGAGAVEVRDARALEPDGNSDDEPRGQPARSPQRAPEPEMANAANDEQDDEPSADDDPESEAPTASNESDPAQASSPPDSHDHEPSTGDRSEPEKPIAGGTPEETTDVVRRAREQLEALQGREPESVSSLERTLTGWTATFEVVELARVPDSTDVMASYEVVLDEQKNVTRYARTRRYYRSQADREAG